MVEDIVTAVKKYSVSKKPPLLKIHVKKPEDKVPLNDDTQPHYIINT